MKNSSNGTRADGVKDKGATVVGNKSKKNKKKNDCDCWKWAPMNYVFKSLSEIIILHITSLHKPL